MEILKIGFKEYPVINELIILGEASNKYRKQITKLIKSKKKRSFIKSNLAQDLRNNKKLYASVGYNFAKVETKTKKLSGNTVDVIIEVERGNISNIKNFIY